MPSDEVLLLAYRERVSHPLWDFFLIEGFLLDRSLGLPLGYFLRCISFVIREGHVPQMRDSRAHRGTHRIQSWALLLHFFGYFLLSRPQTVADSLRVAPLVHFFFLFRLFLFCSGFLFLPGLLRLFRLLSGLCLFFSLLCIFGLFRGCLFLLFFSLAGCGLFSGIPLEER